MTELFTDISDIVKTHAEIAWYLAQMKNNPVEAADFLNEVTNYYKEVGTPEEVEFLQFYFNMRIEMMNK